MENKKEKSIINLLNVDHSKEPMWFGAPLNIQRYDRFKHPQIFTLWQKQIAFMWRPEEVQLSGKEKNDFTSLTEHQKFIFTKNLGYQILLDSVQSRGIPHLMEDLSSPEIEAFGVWWAAMEQIHSYSYTYIIKRIYPDVTETLDEVLKDPEIMKRTASVTKYYDDLIESIPDDTEENKKKKLYLTLVSINILEGIRFYVSFACSYAFAQNKKMEGNAKIISLINRDENLHLGFTQFVLNKMRNDKSEGFQDIVKECESLVIDMYRDAAQEEKDWAKYLFDGGSMLGLNEEILVEYMEWLTNSRMKAIGLDPMFEGAKNPITWIKNWTESKNVQNAPQETQIQSYVVGSFEQDMDDEDYSDFDL